MCLILDLNRVTPSSVKSTEEGQFYNSKLSWKKTIILRRFIQNHINLKYETKDFEEEPEKAFFRFFSMYSFLWRIRCVFSFFNRNYSTLLPDYAENAYFLLKYMLCQKTKKLLYLSCEGLKIKIALVHQRS